MGARVGNSLATATGMLAPECHKTTARLSLIPALNNLWVMTASKIVRGKSLINSDGTLRQGFTLKFYSLPLFMTGDNPCLKEKTFPRLLHGNNSWHHHTGSSVLIKLWWNELERQGFSSFSCELGLPQRKYPLMTIYRVLLYPVFWNANY